MQIRLLAIWGSLIGRWKRVKDKARRCGERGGEQKPTACWGCGGEGGSPGRSSPRPVPVGRGGGGGRPEAALVPGGHRCGVLAPLPPSPPPRSRVAAPKGLLVNKSLGLKFL